MSTLYYILKWYQCPLRVEKSIQEPLNFVTDVFVFIANGNYKTINFPKWDFCSFEVDYQLKRKQKTNDATIVLITINAKDSY